MKPNFECHICGTPLYRDLSQQKQSKSGLYFCSLLCKSLRQKEPQMFSVPINNPIFDAMTQVYANGAPWKRQPEYLTGVYFLKVSNPDTRKSVGDFILTANARINNNAKCLGKTPSDMKYIRDCFSTIKIADIMALPNLPQNWSTIKLKYWNDQPNGITFEF